MQLVRESDTETGGIARETSFQPLGTSSGSCLQLTTLYLQVGGLGAGLDWFLRCAGVGWQAWHCICEFSLLWVGVRL